MIFNMAVSYESIGILKMEDLQKTSIQHDDVAELLYLHIVKLMWYYYDVFFKYLISNS